MRKKNFTFTRSIRIPVTDGAATVQIDGRATNIIKGDYIDASLNVTVAVAWWIPFVSFKLVSTDAVSS